MDGTSVSVISPFVGVCFILFSRVVWLSNLAVKKLLTYRFTRLRISLFTFTLDVSVL